MVTDIQQWADEPDGGPAPKRQRTAAAPLRGGDVPAPRPNGVRGIVRCDCDLEAVRNTTQNGANKGRRFWTCPSSVRAQCGFFAWDDGEDADTSGAGGSGGAGGGGGGECFKCGQLGHWANACPNEGGSGSRGGSRSYNQSSRSGPSRSGGGEGGESCSYGYGADEKVASSAERTGIGPATVPTNKEEGDTQGALPEVAEAAVAAVALVAEEGAKEAAAAAEVGEMVSPCLMHD